MLSWLSFLADKISISELHRVRLIIEPEIARLAALAITPEYSRRLKEALEAEEVPTSSSSEDMKIKIAVHYILAEMCGNRFFEAIVRSSMKLPHTLIEIVNSDPHAMHPASMYRPVVEAVLTGDPKASSIAMHKHTVEFGEILIKIEKAYREKKSLPAIWAICPLIPMNLHLGLDVLLSANTDPVARPSGTSFLFLHLLQDLRSPLQNGCVRYRSRRPCIDKFVGRVLFNRSRCYQFLPFTRSTL